MKNQKSKQGLFFLLFLIYAHVICAGEYYYVFKDRSGATVIQDAIPPEYVNKGYRIINEQGITLKVIPSVSEQRRTASAVKRKKERQIAIQEQRDKDEMLLASFSSVEQIREAGNKKILAVQGQIDVTLLHIKAFEENLGKLQEQAKQSSKKPEGIPQEAVDDVQKIKNSIVRNREFVVRQRQEQHRLREEYMQYIKRYQELTGDN